LRDFVHEFYEVDWDFEPVGAVCNSKLNALGWSKNLLSIRRAVNIFADNHGSCKIAGAANQACNSGLTSPDQQAPRRFLPEANNPTRSIACGANVVCAGQSPPACNSSRRPCLNGIVALRPRFSF
jgi:hypothetical protein